MSKETTSTLAPPPSSAVSLLTDQDLHLFNEGTHYRIYDKLGAHLTTVAGTPGTYFGVWAPNAASVSVVGDFNGWDTQSHPLQARGSSGIWEGFVPGLGKGGLYKYHIVSHNQGYVGEKADPFGMLHEKPPRTASVVWDLEYHWADKEWMETRTKRDSLQAPISVYEVHLGSWMRVPEEGDRPLSYRETGPRLAEYVKRMNFTHVELMPIMEHPFYGSWGYQTTGYFAPTSRYGTPQDFMYLVDYLHQEGIGVFLDWVPSHFPTDAHGLGYFDGTHLFEHADPRKGYHPDWKSSIFNYGRHEVCSFLLSSALFWLDKYHVDGLRVDAVASMLYLDYSRKHGEWIPNRFGGHENLEAITFLRRLNETIYREHHHGELPFRMIYAFHENFVLPLSHDEVVHGKGSLYGMMSGDQWQKYANLRLLFGYMYGMPGKKLLFMGNELAQWAEWNHERSLEWPALKVRFHAGVQQWVKDLN